MPLVVVPFRLGKSRLSSSGEVRRRISLAMLGDVLAACVAVGPTAAVTADPDGAALARELGVESVRDPGGGQGAAVAAALDGRAPEPVLVVNSDVPCVTADELRALLAATPRPGLALVEAQDGTTNALGLSEPAVFAPLFGPGSAARFRDHARSLGLEVVGVPLSNLACDVDTALDLQRLRGKVGPRTRAALRELAPAAVA